MYVTGRVKMLRLFANFTQLFIMLSHRRTPWHSLSFSARELACHAIETYVERLCTEDKDVFDKLKVRFLQKMR